MEIRIANTQNYNELISGDFTVADFYSTTCVPCKMLTRTLEDISLELPFINIVKVNISNNPTLGTENNIEAVPTIIIFKDDKEIDREVGSMTEEEVLDKISKYYYGEWKWMN